MDIENNVPNFLKNYDIEIGTHVLYDSNISKFFTWLAENITDENVLSNDELTDYYDMEHTISTCEQQEILYDKDLEKSLDELNKQFPNLTTYTDNDVKNHENELIELTNLKDTYDSLLNDSNALLIESKRKTFQLNKKLNKVHEHEARLNSECVQTLQEAQDIQNEIQRSRKEIESICSCVKLTPCYIHQFPLEEIFSKCREFNNYCDKYLRKSFKVIDSNVSDVEEDDKYTAEIDRIKQVINCSTFRLKMVEMQLSSIKSGIKEFEMFNRISYDYHDMKHELEQETQSNKEMKFEIDALKETLKKAINKLNQYIVNRLIHEENLHKIQRAEERLKDVQKIDNISHKFMLLCELLWISANFDSEILNMHKNVFKDDTIEERNYFSCLRRIEKFNSLQQEDPVANYTTEFCNEISRRLTRSNFNQITLKEYDDMITNIPTQLETISNKFGYMDINQMLKFLQDNSSILGKFLDDGPLVRPQVVDADIKNKLHYYNIEKTKMEMKYKEQKQTFKEQYKNKYNTDKIWRYSNVLWIWFLTEPNKAIKAIEEIKLQESKSRKVVSGLLCKRD